MQNLHEAQERINEKSPTPLAGSMLYLVVLTLMLLSSFFGGRVNLRGTWYYTYLFMIQIITIAFPPFIYMLRQKINIKKATRLNKISLPEIFLSVGMAFFGYGVILFVNILWVFFLTRFGTPETSTLPPIENGLQYFLAILVIAGVPALFEELLLRGVIQRGYERIGRNASIVLTGILFAFLHLSVVSIPSIIIMGILLCYINYRSNSLFAGVAYHFTNNAIAVTIAFVSNIFTKLLPMEGMNQSSLTDIPAETLKAAVIAWGFIGFFALIFFAACFVGFHILTRGKQQVVAADTDVSRNKRMLELLPAVFAIIVIIILLSMEVIKMVNPVL